MQSFSGMRVTIAIGLLMKDCLVKKTGLHGSEERFFLSIFSESPVNASIDPPTLDRTLPIHSDLDLY